MLSGIFTAECMECGEVCGYSEMLCEKCVRSLKSFLHHCADCGYPMSVDTYHCKHCEDRKKGIDFYHVDYVYAGALRTALRNIKFNWSFRGATQIGELCKMDSSVLMCYDMIVPIPFHFLRRFARFVQPVSLIAAELARRAGTIPNMALKRIRYTQYQSRLNRNARLLNVRNAFALQLDVKACNILLVDDIITTGTTISEAAKVLKHGGAQRVDIYSLTAGVLM